jgi:hypothetical protein
MKLSSISNLSLTQSHLHRYKEHNRDRDALSKEGIQLEAGSWHLVVSKEGVSSVLPLLIHSDLLCFLLFSKDISCYIAMAMIFSRKLY